MTVDGATRVTGLIGDPVAHSRSPAILNAAFREAGLNWIYLAFPVPRGHGGEAVTAARSLGLAGLTVTMPHKADAAWACDDLTPDAAALGAVNVVTVMPDGRLAGASTDGEGFVRSVRDEGFDPAGTDVLVAGAGGAARAIVLALGGAGARVTVAARRRDAADTAAGLVPGGRGARLDEVDPGVFALVVNATPLGMQGEAGPLPVEGLNPGQLVVDTVYHPMETPFLAAARARGIHVANGLGMLVHQAALAFERWTGVEAPLAVMRSAATGDPRMTVVLVAVCSVVGLVVGWMLDPVITRVPRKQALLGPAPPDEPPPAPGRRVTVAIANAVLFGGMAARFDDSWTLVAYLVLTAGLLTLAVIDLETFLLPNRIVYPLTVAMLVLLPLGLLADGDVGAYGRGLLAGVIAFTVFFVVHLISPRGMGFGDVKLSLTLGLALGCVGWGEMILGLFLGFLYGAIIGLLLIVTRLRAKNQAVPFGPFLAAGAITALLVGMPILDWYRGR